LVNIPDEHPDKKGEELRDLLERIFRTKTGKAIAAEKFL